MFDTRPLFRPLVIDFVALLRDVPHEQWDLPTAARGWRVRDVVAHLADTAFRRLSFHRDGLTPTPPADDVPFVTFINNLNAEWINAMRRASPRVLVDLYTLAATELVDWVEHVPLVGPPLFPVSWAGENGNTAWLDIGRDFTEQWHHQMQVRDALGTASAGRPEWLHAVLIVALQGLPHAYRNVVAPDGTAILLSINGEAGGTWTLRRSNSRWGIAKAASTDASLIVNLSDDTAWRLLFNALPDNAVARKLIAWSGNRELLGPLLKARSVIV
jgi:uncharacterized protein (TIGR03083 family)